MADWTIHITPGRSIAHAYATYGGGLHHSITVFGNSAFFTFGTIMEDAASLRGAETKSKKEGPPRSDRKGKAGDKGDGKAVVVEPKPNDVLLDKMEQVLSLVGDLKSRVETLESSSTKPTGQGRNNNIAEDSDDSVEVDVEPSTSKGIKRKIGAVTDNDMDFDQVFAEGSESDDDDFDVFVHKEKEGPPIDDGLAKIFTTGLTNAADRQKIKELVEGIERPKNIPSLKTPKLDSEIAAADFGQAKRRDDRLCRTQDLITASLITVSQLMDSMKVAKKQGQGQMTNPKQVYDKLADTARCLMTCHKDFSQIRREQLKPAVAREFQPLCYAKNFTTVESNDFLFGGDLAKAAEQVSKSKRLTARVASKNGMGRGRMYRRSPQFAQKPGYNFQYKRQGSYRPKSKGYPMQGRQMHASNTKKTE